MLFWVKKVEGQRHMARKQVDVDCGLWAWMLSLVFPVSVIYEDHSFEVRDFNSSSCLVILRVKGREVQCDVNKLLCEVIEAKYTG